MSITSATHVALAQITQHAPLFLAQKSKSLPLLSVKSARTYVFGVLVAGDSDIIRAAVGYDS